MRNTSLSLSVASFAATCSLALVACVQTDDTPDVDRAIPTAEQVKIKLPDTAGNAKTADALGDLSPWYVATRHVTRTLNGGTAWVLVLVHAIVQYPPTTVDGDVYTWGPWSDALDPAEYRLVVTSIDGGAAYDWHLDGRSKIQAGATFETVIRGHAVPGATESTGNGDFTLDFEAGRRVNPIDAGDARGTLTVDYDLAARHLDIAASTLENRGGVETPVDYTYAYDEAADGSGDMVFATHGDTEDAGDLAEDGVVRSRWLATGAGRADLRLSGGDLGATVVTASECWDTAFASVYYSDSASFLPTEGEETACAFIGADLPPL